MHGDITRSTFDPDKGYSSVRQQQGRVQVDADWNEQRDIELHDERRLRSDVVGAHGAPLGDPGMEVTEGGSGLAVGAGRYYVEGIRVENRAPLPLADLPTDDGRYLVYLDVWERPVTAVEDPTIREVALGGPDTSTRAKVTWRVRLLPVTTADQTPDCTSDFPEWDRLVGGSTGTLQVRAEATQATPDPCLVPETAGYRGLDNRTYRIQVHDGNFDPGQTDGAGPGAPSFKWSRDNGAVLAAWIADPAGGVEVQVDRVGPGGNDGFSRGGWVELGNDRHDLREEPGVLAEVDDPSGSVLTLADPGGLAAELGEAYDAQAHPKVRAWDSAGALDLSPGTWMELEHGLQVRFSPSGSWRSGDFWVIPARTAILPGSRNRQIDWPVDGAGDPLPVRPHGPRHHYARLALAERAGGTWKVTGDCRRRFAPLVDDLQFAARGGQGQHAPSGHWLPAPLVAGVSLGTHPLEKARVRFTVKGGGGKLTRAEPAGAGGGPAGEDQVEVTTGTDGLVRVWWRLGPAVAPGKPGDTYQPQAAQEVTAELLDAGDHLLHVPLAFTATAVDPLVLVDAGGNGQLGRPGEILKLALRARVSAGTQPAADQQVAFEIQNRMLDGDALDELRGGSLHASVNLVEVEPWPGGTKTVRAVVATDATGVAQVQWELGNELGLPVQRVTATLLDAAGHPTDQQVLYAAHLAVASEIERAPCKLFDRDPTDRSVQSALTELCRLLGALSTQGRVIRKSLRQAPLAPQTTISLAEWKGLLLITQLSFADDADPSPGALASAVVVEAEVPVLAQPGNVIIGHQVLRVHGNVVLDRQAGGSPVLSFDAENPQQLLKGHAGELRVRVTLFPSLLGAGVPAGVPWHGAFHVKA